MHALYRCLSLSLTSNVYQEMSSNARILEIKGLLDAERLAKAEAIAK